MHNKFHAFLETGERAHESCDVEWISRRKNYYSTLQARTHCIVACLRCNILVNSSHVSLWLQRQMAYSYFFKLLHWSWRFFAKYSQLFQVSTVFMLNLRYLFDVFLCESYTRYFLILDIVLTKRSYLVLSHRMSSGINISMVAATFYGPKQVDLFTALLVLSSYWPKVIDITTWMTLLLCLRIKRPYPRICSNIGIFKLFHSLLFSFKDKISYI